MTFAPKRVLNHEIDTKACAIVSLKFSSAWEIRELTGRDFGVDKIAERFEDGYATSELLMLQIKGTESPIDSDNPCFSLDTKTLIYAEMFSVPFLLVYCSTIEPTKCYYVWLQEYLKVRLNFENPNWKKQKKNTIYFPTSNVLGTEYAEKHLTYISQFPKYQSTWIQCFAYLNDLCFNIPRFIDDDFISRLDEDNFSCTFESATEKLKEAYDKFYSSRYKILPYNIKRAIELGEKIICQYPKLDAKELFKFISECDIIKISLNDESLRFDDNHLRLLYEFDGTVYY